MESLDISSTATFGQIHRDLPLGIAVVRFLDRMPFLTPNQQCQNIVTAKNFWQLYKSLFSVHIIG